MKTTERRQLKEDNRVVRSFCVRFAFVLHKCVQSFNPVGGPWRGEDERSQVRLLGARRKHVLKFIVLGVLQGLGTTEFTNLIGYED